MDDRLDPLVELLKGFGGVSAKRVKNEGYNIIFVDVEVVQITFVFELLGVFEGIAWVRPGMLVGATGVCDHNIYDRALVESFVDENEVGAATRFIACLGLDTA